MPPSRSPLPTLEREFVAASREERDREEAAETQRVARQARANRRLRLQLVVIGVALVVALVGGFIAIDQRSEAEAERRDATARSLAGASSASLVEDPERSILLALASIDATRAHGGEVLPEAIEALHEAVARSRLVLNVPDVGGVVDWSPDGRTFVTAGPEGSGMVEIRDARTGASVLSFRAHEVDINDMAFNADGSLLATTGDDGALRLWDPATGDERVEFDFSAEGEAWGPSFSPDGSRVAAAWPETQVVRMFDLGASQEVWAIRESAQGTEFSPDGERLAIVRDDAPELHTPGGIAQEDNARLLTPVVVDAATGEMAFTTGAGEGEGELLSPEFGGDPTPANGGSGRDAAWSPDGRFLATSSVDGTVVVSDAATGSRRFVMEAHIAPVNALAWSPDSARLATASDDGTARVTEIAADGGGATTSVAAHDTDRGLVSVAFSPSGDRIVTGVSGRTAVKVWDIRPTGGAEWLNVAGHSVRPGASALAFTPDGDALVVGSEDGTIATWDVASGRRLWTSGPVTADRGVVEQLAVSPDGLLVASAVAQGPVELWDASTGRHLRTVLDRLASQRVVSLTWSHLGDVLAVARTYDIEGRIEIVNRAGERASNFYENSQWGIGSASFSPDDRLLVTTRVPSVDNLSRQGLRVWDWQRAETVRTIEAPVVQAMFDPQSQRIAARLEQSATVGVWDAVSGEQVATLPGPAVVNAVAYRSDGSQIATAGVDGAVRLWDPDTEEQDLELRGHGTSVQGVVFSPDGTRLASVGNDGVVRVWALGLDDLVAIAERRLTRSFTDEECRQFLDQDRCPAV
ncbi:MAG: WD40 repeat domain-containing protein [Acidimicrobiales bacterium]